MYKLIIFVTFICLVGGAVEGADSGCDFYAAARVLPNQKPVVVSHYGFDSNLRQQAVIETVSSGLKMFGRTREFVNYVKSKFDTMYQEGWYCYLGAKITFDSDVDEYIKLKLGNLMMILFRNDANSGDDKEPIIEMERYSLQFDARPSACNMAPDVAGMAAAEPVVVKKFEFDSQMSDDAIESVREAAEGAEDISDIVHSVRAKFDKLYGDGWICVAAKEYTSTSFEYTEFIGIKISGVIITLYRNKE